MAVYRFSSLELKASFFSSQSTWRDIVQGERKSYRKSRHSQCGTFYGYHYSPGSLGFLVEELGRKFGTNANDHDYPTLQMNLHRRQTIPVSPPPRTDDLALLYQFIQNSRKLVVLTGAGISTESGIPDYRSPNGAYNRGFKPMTHQEFIRSDRMRRRYWARSYAGWTRFISAQPGPTHRALAQLEARGYIDGIITQNVDRLHHSAGSSPLELHGTTHEVVCLDCGHITSRHQFQDRVKLLNPEWSSAVQALENGEAGSNVGMQQRPDGDIEIDESFWEANFQIPACEQCGGILKPDVVFFGDNIPKLRADKALAMVTSADGLLVMGSSLMVLSAFRLAKAAHERDIPVSIVNIGSTRADHLASLKIESRSGEILSRVLDMGSLCIPFS